MLGESMQVGHLHGTDLGEGHTAISLVVGLLARVGVIPQLGLGAEEIQGVLGDDEKNLFIASVLFNGTMLLFEESTI